MSAVRGRGVLGAGVVLATVFSCELNDAQPVSGQSLTAQHHVEHLPRVARAHRDHHLGVRRLESLEDVGKEVRADGQRGRDDEDLAYAPVLVGLQHHPRQPRVDRQLRQPAAQRGEALARIGPRLEVRAWLKEWTGVSIYRDGFRIWPYGEPHDDWLRLDQRRVNSPVEHLSNNQVIGFIDIGRDRNPELMDQTNREGLIHNPAFEDLRKLVEAAHPVCLSIYQPAHRAGPDTRSHATQDLIRLKNLLRAAADRLTAGGLRPRDAEDLLAPARRLLDDAVFWQYQSDGLAVFLAPGMTRTFRIPIRFEELVVVAPRFHVKPLLPLLTGDGLFYVLALSQNEVRLLAGTRNYMGEVELPGAPRSLAEALQYDDPER